MKRFRHRSLRTRFAVLSIMGLLWSQLVLANHPLCSTTAMALAALDVATTSVADDCHLHTMPSTDASVCLAHCSQGDLSKDVARVPAIPALPPVAPLTFDSFALLPADLASHPGLPPPASSR